MKTELPSSSLPTSRNQSFYPSFSHATQDPSFLSGKANFVEASSSSIPNARTVKRGVTSQERVTQIHLPGDEPKDGLLNIVEPKDESEFPQPPEDNYSSKQQQTSKSLSQSNRALKKLISERDSLLRTGMYSEDSPLIIQLGVAISQQEKIAQLEAKSIK